jgi:hypothetical protein
MNRSPEHHILISFDQKRVFGAGGVLRAFPKPAGMSGSPVWLLYDEIEDNNKAQNAVVGVLIEYHDDRKIMVATDIGVALDLIMKTS